MDTLSYEGMMAAHTNPGLPGEGLGGLGLTISQSGRTANVKLGYATAGLVSAALVYYYGKSVKRPTADKEDLLLYLGSLVAGGLLTHSLT